MQVAARISSRIILAAALAAGLAALPGCKPSAPKQAAPEKTLAERADELAALVQERQQQGQLAEARSLVEQALSDPQFAEQKPRFFDLKLELLLAQKQDAAAGDAALAAWRTDPGLARAGAERLTAYYQQQNNPVAQLRWCERMLGLGADLPADQRATVLGWHLAAGLATRDAALARSSLDLVLRSLPPEQAADFLHGPLCGLADSGQHELAKQLARHLAEQPGLPPAGRSLVATLDLRCATAAADWAAFPAAFEAAAAQLPDAPLGALLRQTFLKLQKAGQTNLLEQSSHHVIAHAAYKTNAVNLAARIWVECGVAARKQVLPERLDALLQAQVQPAHVGGLLDRYFYEMVDDPATVRKLCTLAERILAVCKDKNTEDALKIKVLEGAFLLEDYDLAVQMLEQGIPGKDQAWHDMSLPKVKAHRALAQKNPREAVACFRAFMDAWLASDQQEEVDPTSGVAYSREWILGRNANRIANILASIPDPTEADKARAEAKAYFKVALEKAKDDAEALRLLKEETKDLGL